MPWARQVQEEPMVGAQEGTADDDGIDDANGSCRDKCTCAAARPRQEVRTNPKPNRTMSKIQFGSEVYTWFMQGTGKGYDNKLDHMIKIAGEAGFTGIEPMVLEISQSALGCSKYWLGDFA